MPYVWYDEIRQFLPYDAVHCATEMATTGCESPTCAGFRCVSCGHGCDWNEEPSGCRLLADSEEPEEKIARLNRARAVIGEPLLNMAEEWEIRNAAQLAQGET